MRLHNDKVDQLTTQNLDMKLRRCINASPSQDSKDYIIKQELDYSTGLLRDSLNTINSFIKKLRTYLGTLTGLAPYSPVDLPTPFPGLDNSHTTLIYADVADVNNLRAGYEGLKASHEDLRAAFEALRTQVQNAVK